VINSTSQSTNHTWRVGADVGGTFTDVLVLDDESGAFGVAKTLTTPDDPSVGVLHGIRSALGRLGITASELANVIHGTTLVTNAIIERAGAPTALVTTNGFRDVLDIAREHRYDMYDLLLQQPRPLVPRSSRFEVDERIFADGSVHRPVNLADVDAAARQIRKLGIRSVAIVFLHSFRNPEHEKLVEARFRELLPEVRVSRSSEVAGEIREYERTTTTIANAYVQELLDGYLARLESDLRADGFAGWLFMMLSSGGLATVETAGRFPVRSIESGPAAGALAAAEIGRRSGRLELLSFDMGGTTAKACLIENGRPFTTTEFEVDRVYRFKQGSGLPIRAPGIEMIEIGAGGGSIARIDQFGLIRVGPDSAGASPGPACYGLGGRVPTVTDADLVLGYLNPDFFLGGDMRLDPDAAAKAIDEQIARPIGLSVTEAAWAIHQVVNENMASAARIHAVERGKDARRYPLFAFGGAGPVHAFRVARILGQSQVIAPYAAGVGSTFGFLAAPVSFDFVRGAAGRIDRLDWEEIDELYREMEREGRALLIEAGVDLGDVSVTRSCDMRLSGQAHQIDVPVPAGRLSSDTAPVLQDAFDTTYLALFKRAAPGVPAEALNWRLRVAGPPPRSQPIAAAGRPDASDSARKGTRPVYFPEGRDFHDTPVYDRYRLKPGDTFRGSAIVEERESTLVVGMSGEVDVDEWLNLIVTLDSGVANGG
jgi:N-methylhydantoinase A